MIFITYMRYGVFGLILGEYCFTVNLHENEKTFKIEMPNELFFIFLSRDLSKRENTNFQECLFV